MIEASDTHDGHDCWGWSQTEDGPNPQYPPTHFACDECHEEGESTEMVHRWTFRWRRPPLHGPHLNRMAQLQGWHDRLLAENAKLKAARFEPDLASLPSKTITDAMVEQGITDLQARLGLNDAQWGDLLTGAAAITPHLAERLAKALGGTMVFWLTREVQYRAAVARLAGGAS